MLMISRFRLTAYSLQVRVTVTGYRLQLTGTVTASAYAYALRSFSSNVFLIFDHTYPYILL
jgi:hypothetical protein